MINAPHPDGSLTATRTFAFPNRVRVMRDTLAVRSLHLPLPTFAGVTVDECADSDGQRVDVRVRSPLIGEIFRYTGTFTYEHLPRDEGVAE